MLFFVDTDKNRAVFSVLEDYSLAIYFVHAVKKLEWLSQEGCLLYVEISSVNCVICVFFFVYGIFLCYTWQGLSLYVSTMYVSARLISNRVFQFLWGCSSLLISFSRKLSGEKAFANFAVMWLYVKVLSAKSGGVASFGTAKASNPQKFSRQKMVFFNNSWKFSPLKVSRYTVLGLY